MALPRDRIKKLRVDRKKLEEQARQILDDAGDESLSTEAEERFNAIHDDIEGLDKRIDLEERQLDLETRSATSQGAKIGLRNWGGPEDSGDDETRQDGDDPGNETRGDDTEFPEGRSAFDEVSFRYLTQGTTQLRYGDGEEISLQRVQDAQMDHQVRALSGGTGSQGGFLVSNRYFGMLQKGMDSFGGLRESRARRWTTTHGAAITIATLKDDEMGEVIAENQPMSLGDIQLGQLVSGTVIINSKIILVPVPLLEDQTEANLQSELFDVGGTRIERRIQYEATVNDQAATNRGNDGYLVASPKGADAALPAAIAFDDILDLKSSVDRRFVPNGEFSMAYSTFRTVRKLKNANGDPLWRAGGEELGAPNTIDGSRYHWNDYVPAIGASAKSMAFGDFSKLRLRMVRGVTMFRFNEKFMDHLQIGFVAFVRAGHLLIDAGDNPIKYLQHPA